MSAPILWIVLPGIFAVGLIFLGRWERIVYLLGFILCVWVAASAWILPIDTPIEIGVNSYKVSESLRIMGRDFILNNADRTFISLIYLVTAIWLLGGYLVGARWWFVPFSLGIVVLFIAAISVEPFLFAALMIELAALLAIPLLSPPDQKPGRGVYRFLVFQTLGMPFILFSGWILAGAEVGTTNLDLIVRAGVILGIGFAFLMAVLPFHSWIPMVVEESDIYISGFILYIFPGMVSLFGLSFLDRYVWLQESDVVLQIIQSVGVLMVLLGGLWTASSDHLGKMYSFNIVVEIGMSLMAISLASQLGVMIFFWLFFSKAIPFVVWAVGMSTAVRDKDDGLKLNSVSGLIYNNPVVAWMLVISQLSLVGVPLLAVFPVRLNLMIEIAKRNSNVIGWIIVGVFGLLIGAIRVIIAFYNKREDIVNEAGGIKRGQENAEGVQRQWLYLSYTGLAGYLMVILWLGLYPQGLIRVVGKMLEMFSELTG